MDDEKRLRYGGVEVRFPYPPYRAQHALMHGIITAANSGNHALLESPTGTGKSLALLCGALAWQEHIEQKIKDRKTERENAALNVLPPPKKKTTPEKKGRAGNDEIETAQPKGRVNQENPSNPPTSTPTKPKEEKIPRRKERKPKHRRRKKKSKSKPKQEEDAGSDADFQDPIEFRDTSWQKHAKVKRPRSAIENFGNAHLVERFESWERDAPLDADEEFGQDEFDSDLSDNEGDLPRKVPRIFFATRTHNQVSQVVDELRKTSYRPSMTVLASRREYCVRTEVQQLKNRNDVCKGLIKARKCNYFHNAQDLAQRNELDGEVWDIEELFNLGKKHNGCPYYTSSEMYKNARIIFCPYNYIVDKTVRDAAGIKIKGDIVVFDEAHNIENYARESASFSIDVADFRGVIDDLNELIEEGKLGSPNSDLTLAGVNIIEAFANVMRMIDYILAMPMEQDFDTEFARIERQDLGELFEMHGVTPGCIQECRKAISLIRERHEDDEEDKDKEAEHENGNGNGSQGVGYSNTGGVGYGGPEEGPEIQTPAIIRKRRRRQKSRNNEETEDEAAPKSVSRCLFFANKLTTTLEFYFPNRDDYCLVLQRRVKDFLASIKFNLWCHNSAVAFQPLAKLARTIVVTSGTLSPLRSFAGELGTEFAVAKSLPHVINARKQLHVAVVSRGPGDVLFDATYASSSMFQFQDSLGEALVQYCECVPAGVLVFLPSYRLLDKLRTRWQMSGIMERFDTVKGGVFFEPNKRGEEFDRMMVDYAEAATSPSGAILFGVCRGKLAEGIDFRDETSRAVVIVGIPFPHRGDLQVIQKQEWNNRRRSMSQGGRSNIMSGSDWYQMQGYRALNQALGRTIRHRLDFGSILLLDHRYRNPDVMNQLPGWTQESFPRNTRGSHEEAVGSLRRFFSTVQENVAQVAGLT